MEELMNIINLESPKFLVGLEIRTKNSDEFSANGKIPKLWEIFYQDSINEKIKDKISENIYAIYSNYQSDHTGEYDYFIGYEVQNTKTYMNDDKLIIKEINPGRYSVVTTEKGSVQKVIPAAWEKILKMSPSELGGKRLFRTDYEIYTPEMKDSNGTIFKIYLGIND
jgi:predicted transcriptional regulator YdeE